MLTHNPHVALEVYGSLGSAQLRFTFFGPNAGISGYMMTDAHADRQPFVTPVDYFGIIDHFDIMQLFLHEHGGINAFVHAVHAQRPCTPSFADGLTVQIVLGAARASAATGRRIVLA